MRKAMTFFLILIFLPVCVSFGAIFQSDGYQIGAENGVVLLNGPGAVQNTNTALVSNNNLSSNPYNSVTAMQSETGMLVQGAYAGGVGGAFGVGQVGNVLAGQLQTLANNNSLGTQDQALITDFGQELVKGDGVGAALGIQGFFGIQAQLIITPKGANTNINFLGLGLFDSTGGGP